MHGFPFEACPTAADLLRYATGASVQTERDQLAFVERHLQACGDCTRAAEGFRMHNDRLPHDAFGYLAEQVRPPRSDDLDHQIAAQRELLNRVLSSSADDPRPGDVWISTYRHDLGVLGEPGLPWLMLVLDSYRRDYTASWVVDAVPVTEDPQVAADWSFIVPEEHNDFGMTFVAHLDFQFTTSREALQRRLGRLTEVCFECVRLVLRAFEVGETAPECAECGTLGSASIRSRVEWLALDAELGLLIDRAMVSFDDESKTGPDDEAPMRPCQAELGLCPGFSALNESLCQRSPPMSRVSTSREWPTTRFNLPFELEEDWEAATLLGQSAPAFRSWPGAGAREAVHAQTVGDALHLFLQHSYGSDLQEWCARANQSVSWSDLAPVLELPVGELLGISAMDRIPWLRSSVRLSGSSAVLRLVNEAIDFLSRHLAANEGLGLRAARRQDPFRRLQG